MRKFLFLTLLNLWALVAASPLFAQESGGKVILELQEEDEQPPQIDYGLLWLEYSAEVKEYDKAYPGNDIEEDFIDDVRQRHPDFTFDGATWRENAIRYGVKGYRLYNFVKGKFQEFMLENDLPLLVDDEDYEDGRAPQYQKTDKPLIIQDFKKVVAYSDSPRDRAAVRQKMAERAGDMSYSEKVREIKAAILRGDWKAAFSYGLFDGKPVEDFRGLGVWTGEKGKLRARLAVAVKTTAGHENINGALQIQVPEGEFLLNQRYKDFTPVTVDFSASENLGNIKLNWPLPRRLYLSGKEPLTGYAGVVQIPFEIQLRKAGQPLALKAHITGIVCNADSCVEQKIITMLDLSDEPVEGEAKAASFLRLVKSNAPQETHPEIKLRRLIVEKPIVSGSGQVLRLDVHTENTTTDFDAFIEGDIQSDFASPLIRVDGQDIFVRFRALNPKADYTNKKIAVIAGSQSEGSVRRVLQAEKTIIADAETPSLTLRLLWFALLGGFLLNLMPCGFPVLSLKLISCVRLGTAGTLKVRSTFLFSALGIACAWILLTAGLSVFKMSGYFLGWGIQFQNICFLSFMIFVVSSFWAYVWTLPQARNEQNEFSGGQRLERLSAFLSGMLLVLLSIPCPSPFLGTALGFALTGGVGDIIILFAAAGVGLMLPYLLIAAYPELTAVLPVSEHWLQRISRLNMWLLLVALFWLLILLTAQTSGTLFWHFGLFVTIFWGILWLRAQFIQTLGEQEDDPVIFQRIRRLFNLISFILLLALAAVVIADSVSAHQKKQLAISRETVPFIDMSLVDNELRQGRSVLVKVTADWCLTCLYNDFTVWNTPSIKELLSDAQITLLTVDWTAYNPEIMRFMENFSRRNVPFYVIFTPRFPSGMVLPEIVTDAEIRELVNRLNY